ELRGHIVTGTVSRVEGGSVTVNLGKVEGILPRGEQIPGESHRVGERVRAVVIEVKKAGTRVKIILSRTHPELVRRLFELEIPEVAEHVIEVRSLAREAGYRSKVAVSCYDSKVDAVGACVGVRGSRIKSIVDELAGERIDIVRWNDSLQVLVPNALQPADVEDVILCPMLGKVIVLVRDDQLSLAIGKKGQNVRLASKLVGWDINVMTQERLDVQLDKAVRAFSEVPGISDELAENLVAQGFFTFDDLSVIEPDQLAELGSLTPEQCDEIVAFADERAAQIERDEQLAALHAVQAAREGATYHAGDGAKTAAPSPAASAPAVGEPAVSGEPEASAESVLSESEPAAASTSEETAPVASGDETGAADPDAAETLAAETAAAIEGESTGEEQAASERLHAATPSGNGHGEGEVGEGLADPDEIAAAAEVVSSAVSAGHDSAEPVDADVSRDV
ncbi:MAG TPA: transcription termination factor NusA, partial [Planctomycetaceae bacterium]|nr:transcription termination factor NusA [Planctomycetaceae bacterium]